MSFLKPLLGPLIGLGGSILGAQAAKPSAEEKAALASQTDYHNTATGALKSGIDLAGKQIPNANIALGGFFNNLGPAADYWRAILSGDRAKATSMLAPQIRQINESYDTTRQTGAELMPRGGGSASLLSELPYRKAGDINDLFSRSRTEAAGALPAIAGAYGTTGTNLLSIITGAYKTGGPNTGGLLNYGLNSRAQTLDLGTSLGRGIFDLLKKLPKGGGGFDVPGVPNDYPQPPK